MSATFLESCRAALPAGDRSRAEAFARALARGLPTRHLEDWKYSDASALAQKSFAAAPASTTDIGPWRLPELAGPRLVFVNGLYSAALSEIGNLPAGVKLSALAASSTADEMSVPVINGQASTFTELNAALYRDGLCLYVAAGVNLTTPLHLLHLQTAPGGITHVRNQLHLEQGARAEVIEHYAGLEGEYFCNAVTEVQLDDDAQLRHYRLQQHGAGGFHVGSLHASLGTNSQLHTYSADLGGFWVRNDVFVKLAAPGAQTHLYGVYAPFNRQHVDNHTRVDHLAPNGTSREAYKGIMNGHGRGVFNGKIIVHPNAQKTDSEQSSAALLLSRTAEVDAKPELEIYADDVKCKHGATVGQLDEDAVFYLQSRGVSAEAARSLLTYSFADEIIGRIEIEPLRKWIERALLARLPGSAQFEGLLQ